MAIGTLTTFDFTLIIIYFVTLILIGYFSSRKQSNEDFLIAKRDLGTWKTMFTVNASKMGSILMTFTALTFIWGFAAIWFFIGIIVGMLVFLPFALRLHKLSNGKYYTLADYFKHNYGKKTAIFASVIGSIILFGYLMINLVAGSKIFVFFTGWPFWVAAIIMVSIVLIYITLAGFRGVVKTDIVQYIAMVAIMLLLVILLFDGSLIPISELNILNIGAVSIFGFFLVGILSAFALPDLWQRVYSAKSRREFRNGWFISIVIYTFMVVLLSILALTVKSQFPNIDPDLALIHGFANLLPSGLVGLSVVLLFAAIMSSIDTYIFTTSSSIVQDFSSFDKEKTVKLMKRTMIIITVLATLLAIWVQNLVLSGYLFVSFVIVLSIPVIATWINKKVKHRTLMISFSLGLITLILSWIYIWVIGEFKVIILMPILGASILGLIIGKIVSYFKR